MEEGTKAFVKEVKALPKAVRDEDCFKVGALALICLTCIRTDEYICRDQHLLIGCWHQCCFVGFLVSSVAFFWLVWCVAVCVQFRDSYTNMRVACRHSKPDPFA